MAFWAEPIALDISSATTGSGAEAYTPSNLAGRTPRAVVFFGFAASNAGADGAHFRPMFGAADGTRQVCQAGSSADASASSACRVAYRTDRCVLVVSVTADTLLAQASLQSFDVGGLTLNFSAAPTISGTIYGMAFGGDAADFDAYVWSDAIIGTATTQAITGVGFAPNVALSGMLAQATATITNATAGTVYSTLGMAVKNGSGVDQAVVTTRARNGVATMETMRASMSGRFVVMHSTTALTEIKRIAVQSFDSNGLTLNHEVAGANLFHLPMLMLRVPQASLAVVDSLTSTEVGSTPNRVVSTPGMIPRAVLYASTWDAALVAAGGTPTTGAQRSVGAASSSAQWAHHANDNHGTADSEARSTGTVSAAFLARDFTETAVGRITGVTMTTQQITEAWNLGDASARKMLRLILGETFVSGTGAATAPAATTSGSGAPTVTGSGTVTAPAATAAGSGTVGSAIPFDVIQNFSSGSGALDSTKLAAGAHGAAWGTWNTGGTADHTVIENHAVTLPFDLSVAGTLYNGGEGQGITFDHSADPAVVDAFDLDLSVTKTTAQALALARFDVVDASGGLVDYNVDLLMFAGANYSVSQYHHDFTTAQWIQAHSEGQVGYGVPYSGGWVILGLLHDTANNRAEVYIQDRATGTILGASTTRHVTPAGDLVYFRFADYLRNAGTNKTGSIKIKLIALRESGPFPAYTLTVPAPTVSSLLQTAAGEVRVTFGTTVDRIRIERRMNGGAWGVIDAATDTTARPYVDTGLVDGATYEYRLTAIIGNQESTQATSSPIVIDDSAFEGGELWLSQTLGGTIDVDNQRGIRFTVGSQDIRITQLGLWIIGPPGQYTSTIPVKLYDSAQTLLGSVDVPTTGTPNQYAFAALGSPITLTAGQTYWLVAGPLGYNRIHTNNVITPVPAIGSVYMGEGTPPSMFITDSGKAFGPVNAIYEIPSSGVTGTGAATAPAATASGSGAPIVTGTGTATAPAGTASGAGFAYDVHVPVGGLVLSGDAPDAITGSGTPSAPAATASGTGTPVITGSGAATAPATTTGGTGAPVITGSGNVTAPAQTGSGGANSPVSGSGDVTAPAATGSGAGTPVISGSGAAAAPSATGNGTGTPAVTGSGVATAGPATTSGSGSPVVSGAGAVTAPAATTTGNNIPGGSVTGTGDAVAPAAGATGSGTPVIGGAGAVTAPAGQGGAAGTPVVSGSGDVAVVAPAAALSGTPVVGGTGTATAPAASTSGAGVSTVTGAGTTGPQAPTTGGAGAPVVTGAGTVTSPAPSGTGTGPGAVAPGFRKPDTRNEVNVPVAQDIIVYAQADFRV